MNIKRNGLPTSGGNPISLSVEVQGFLFVSGCTPKNEEGKFVSGTIELEATTALDNLMRRLHDAGYDTADVIRVGVWLEDPRDAADFNKVYRRYFKAEHAPARVCIQGSMIHACKVEVDCIAWKEKT